MSKSKNIYFLEREAEELLENKRAVEAINLIKEKEAENELTAEGRIIYAHCLVANGELSKAEDELLKVIAIQPDSPSALKMLSLVYKKSGNCGKAEYYNRRFNDLLNFIGEADSFWGDFSGESVGNKSGDTITAEELIKGIKKLLGEEFDTVFPFETKTLAELFIKQNHLNKGLSIYRRLLEKEPYNKEMIKRVADLLKSATVKAEM